MQSTNKLGHNEDSETCENLLQIAHLLVGNGGVATFLGENDDSEECDSVLQIGHLVVSNRGQLELHRKSFKQ